MPRPQQKKTAATEADLRVFSEPAETRLRAYFERICEPVPLRARTKQEWIERRSEVRQKTLGALGLDPMPPRVPLDIRTGGVLEREGYRVERTYWQTWPGVWASGWLYTPAQSEGKTAAVLNLHGHWEGGALHPMEQSRCIAQAKLGYVALMVDSSHLCDYAVGLTPETVMVHQNLRALDLLVARPDVDRERVGVMGVSGGAQQAMYLMAADDRIRSGVLVLYASYYRRILELPDRCACNYVPGMMRFTDEPELLAIPSPRAMLYLTATGDWTVPFGEHELGELRAIYRLWGQEDRLGHQQFEGPHELSRPMREASYTWLERELRGNRKAEPVTEPEHEVQSAETLQSLNSPPAENRGEDGIREWFQKRVVAQPPQLESKQSRRNYQDRARAELRQLLGDSVPATLDAQPGSGVGLTLRSERDVRIPVIWLPSAGEKCPGTVIALHPEGKSGALKSPLVQALRDGGYSILAPDVRLRGEMRQDWAQACVLWGRPEAGMAVDDTLACVQWLWEQAEVDPKSILLLGEGAQGIVALMAAGLDERITATVADCRGTTYRDGGEGLPVIPNILRVADVPQLASLVAPRPLWLYNVPGERVGFSSRRYYDWTRRTFQSLGELEALKITTDASATLHGVPEWLQTRIRRAHR